VSRVSAENSSIYKKKIATKRIYKKHKLRSNLAKTCTNRNCSEGQYYLDESIANKYKENFKRLKSKTAKCLCGSDIRYFVNGKKTSSSNLKKSKNIEI